jgi:hypothetical protein
VKCERGREVERERVRVSETGGNVSVCESVRGGGIERGKERVCVCERVSKE